MKTNHDFYKKIIIITSAALMALSLGGGQTAFCAVEDQTNEATEAVYSNPDDKILPSELPEPSTLEGPTLWVTLGAGPVKTESKGGREMGGTAELNYRFSNHQLLTARATGYHNFDFRLFNDHTRTGYLKDYGFLYGYIAQSRLGYLSASVGVSYFESKATYDPDRQPRPHVERTIGLPLELQAIWKPTSHGGIGLILTADINAKTSFLGTLLALQWTF